MMESANTYIGRQPILDTNGNCVSYELLYRGNITSLEAGYLDNTKATARVILNLMHNIGTSTILNGKTAFINVDETSLLSDIILSLPKDQFVFEILEFTQMSDTLINRIRELHEMGYRFSLDDFDCRRDRIEYFKPLFDYVEVIKIDVLATDKSCLEAIVNLFRPYPIKLLAEKVETIEMYELYKNAGFELFQGYFFEKPSILSGKQIEPSVAKAIELINILQSETHVDSILEKFMEAPELTFMLLKYINSAEFNFNHKITSIKQILNLLGPARVRAWLGLFLYMESEDKPFRESLVEAAKFRANFMSSLVKIHGNDQLFDEAFFVGSLSLIDTYLQVSMDEIIEKINLSDAMTDALFLRTGYLGKLLSISEKLERSEELQKHLEYIAPKIKLSTNQLYKIYIEAC
ncbi:EAL and HDOD domain-containing protein [Sulfuricurvum sp.]|uniref:EAL and HDOD domain-containing protein n=1 Tax=Sulfuricurvum sp. TaxID=2025608 RepID=UPI002E331B0B|nr:EAL domain-containing protein [Sulfuricurvum sp.]HEX5330650.1 EAL domain-containing protein [Sulfuricurvum sp.]